VITVSIVTAMLPALSRLAHSGDRRTVGLDVGSTMRIVAALVMPVAAFLAVTGAGIAVLLFGYGAATPEQAALMGTVVSVFMLGLLPFTLFYVLLRGYYALEDTRTPFWLTVGFSIVLIALMVPLFSGVTAGGAQIAVLAGSYSAAYWVGFIAAWIILSRKLGGVDARRTIGALLRMAAATLIALAAMIATQYVMVTSVTGGGLTDRLGILANVVAVLVVGTVMYLLAGKVLRVRELSESLRIVRSKIGRGVSHD